MDARQDGLPVSSTLPRLAKPSRRWQAVAGALLACALLAAGAYWLTRNSLGDGNAQDTPPGTTGAAPSLNPAQMFADWTNPDFVLFLTGQSHGYLQPCGCSSPQYGGLARRWELMAGLDRKGWTLIPIDVGEIAASNRHIPMAQARTPVAQNHLKYETSMRALAAMGYHAVGVGHDEFQAGLMEILPRFALNKKRPRHVAANLDGNPPGIFKDLGVAPYEIAQAGSSPKIGIIGVVGATVANNAQTDPQVKITWAINALPDALKELKAKTEFNVLLFQGGEEEAEKCAEWCAAQRQKQPGLAPLHLVLHTNKDPEPPGVPKQVGGTELITVGHKGKYVGVLGVWRKGNAFQTKYQMVAIGPEFDPGKGNPILPLMEEYATKVKERNFAAQFLFGPHKSQRLLQDKVEVKYVGSERCADCHDHASHIWDKSGHSHAYDTLKKAVNPSLRQFDGECLQCHTVGFKHDSGWNDPRIAARVKDKLLGVGCESCHGPASMHVNAPNNKDFYPLINEFAAKHNPRLQENVRLQRLDDFCQSCHDTENDVHWNFQQKWPRVMHMTPKGKNAPQKP